MTKKIKFIDPSPRPFLMRISGLLSELFLLRGIPILRSIPYLRNIPGIGGYFKISKICITDTDIQSIKENTNPKNAFFVGPNHPEFTTDWLIDKYISTRFAPRMASWAAASIISGPLKPFWLANNIIANNGGDAAKHYSVESALRGDGVLLHPEGSVRWRGDKVFELLPGIVDMAIQAKQTAVERSLDKRVLILPLVWKLVYDQSIEVALNESMNRLESKFGLPHTQTETTGRRYYLLQQNLLLTQSKKLGFDRPHQDDSINFAKNFFSFLLNKLTEQYGLEMAPSVHKTIHRGYKLALKNRDREALAVIEELQRLSSYSEATFSKGYFTQEEIAEGLQFLKQIFLTKGYDGIKSFLPKPFGWRTLHLSTVQEIEIEEKHLERNEVKRDLLLKRLEESMQTSLIQLVENTPTFTTFEHNSLN